MAARRVQRKARRAYMVSQGLDPRTGKPAEPKEEGSAEEQKGVKTEKKDGELEGEGVEGEGVEGENVEGENVEGENVEGENLEGENLEGENLEEENLGGENLEEEEEDLDEEQLLLDDDNADTTENPAQLN